MTDDPAAIMSRTLDALTPIVEGLAEGIESTLAVVQQYGPMRDEKDLAQVESMDLATTALEKYAASITALAARARAAVDELRRLNSKGKN